MCSRFEIKARPRDVARHFDQGDLPGDFGPDLLFRDEVRPTDAALVFGASGFQRLSWGLQVDWDSKPLINARAETLTEKKTFQPLLGQRCVVPATAYFEWRRDGKRRLKNRIAPRGTRETASAGLFSFAGLTDGARFTIVTCPPLTAIASIHNRMPVILMADGERRWLNGNLPFADVAPLLVPDGNENGDLDLIAEEDVPAQPDLFG